MHSYLLAPIVALVLWTFVMCAWLYATRIPALMKNRIIYDPYRPNEAFHAQLPAQVRLVRAVEDAAHDRHTE